MTAFEQAVFVIGESFREDDLGHDFDCVNDMVKCYMMDSNDLKEECLYALRDGFDGEFTDDCEIIDNDGSIYSFRKLAKAVRSYKF